MKYYYKLVRNNIPTIIEESGKKCHIHIADDGEYLEMLYKKLLEESKELKFDKDEEEIADLLEVIDAIVGVLKLDKNKIENIKKEKCAKRGSFDKKIILEAVDEDAINIANNK